MNVKELKTAVYEFLISLNTNVYDGQTVGKIQYPYIVYSLDSSLTDLNETREDFALTVDVFDNNQLDTSALDALIGLIDGDGIIAGSSGLHRKHYYESGVLQADFYRSSRNTLYETNENIRHVELTYDVMVYLE